MSVAQRPLQLIEVVIALICIALAWPITIHCSAPFQICKPVSGPDGELIYNTTTEPYGIVLLEKYLQQDFKISYKTGTTIERPVFFDGEKTATDSTEPANKVEISPSPTTAE